MIKMELLKVFLVIIPVLLHVQWTQQECFFGTDLALMIDISQNVGPVEIHEVSDFGQSILSLVAAHDRSLVSLVTYRNEPLIRFTFDDWVVESARSKFLEVFQTLGSSSNQSHHAFLLLRDKVFTAVNGARDGITDVVLLVTDRPASDIAEAERRAGYLKTMGALIFIVAIGDVITDFEIQRYITKSSHFLRVPHFDNLEIGYNELRNAVFNCAPCPQGWIKPQDDDGYCYIMVNNRMAWQTAEENCESIANSSQLVGFRNQKQMKWITDEFNDRGGTGIWVGLSRNYSTENFRYVDGSPFDPTIGNWEANYPQTELCVHYSKNGIADDNCDAHKQSICQLSQAGIV